MNFGKIKRTFKRRWSKVSASRRAVLVAFFIGFFNVYLCCTFGNLPYQGELGNYLDRRLIDLWFLLRGQASPPKDVVIISVDERSHEALGASMLGPWPRVLTAKLLEKLAEYKPKKIMLDFRYAEKRDPVIDERLAKAIQLSPTYIARFKNEDNRTTIDGTNEESYYLDPAPLFKKSARGTYFAVFYTQFGVIRNFYTGDKSNDYTVPAGQFIYDGEAKNHPLPSYRDFINFYGPPGTVPSVPFFKVLDEEHPLPLDAFKDKYVFVGQQLFLNYTATQTDTFMTPYNRYTAGVEIHATTVANLLTQSWISNLSIEGERIYQFLFAAIASYLIIFLKPSQGGVLLGCVIFGWAIVSYTAFRFGYFIPGVIPVLLVLPLLYVFTCVRYYFRMRQLEVAMGLKKS